MKYKNIRNLISEGNLSEALECLKREVVDSNISEKNEIILQSARFQNILKEKNVGTVSHQESDLVINQVFSGVLSLIDRLEKKYPELLIIERQKDETSGNLNNVISSILGKEVSSFPSKNTEQIKHLIKLYDIHTTNLHSSEKAAAMWGELVPKIVIHSLSEDRQKIEEIKLKIANLI